MRMTERLHLPVVQGGVAAPRRRHPVWIRAQLPSKPAFFVATREAIRKRDGYDITAAVAQKCDEAEFIMLKDGGIAFEGNAAELRASSDPYIREFLS